MVASLFGQLSQVAVGAELRQDAAKRDAAGFPIGQALLRDVTIA
jgi:hypothetical protein